MAIIRRGDVPSVGLEGRTSGDPLRDLESESSLRIVDLEPGAGRTAHRHPHSEEIVIVVSGDATVWIDGETFPVGEGDVIRIPRGAAHATIPSGPTRLHCFFPHPELEDNMEMTDIVVTDQT